jgi:hypothetical protein
LPPTVAVTVPVTSASGGEDGAAAPLATGGFVTPKPVMNTSTTSPAVAGAELFTRLLCTFKIAPWPVPA